MMNENFRAAVITLSDRSYNGEREDLSGPAIVSYLKERGYTDIIYSLLPDDRKMLEDRFIELSDEIKVERQEKRL